MLYIEVLTSKIKDCGKSEIRRYGNMVTSGQVVPARQTTD